MIREQFSLGPWWVGKRKQYADGTWERIDVFDAWGDNVCGVCVVPKQEANACLIASAPEMYQLLQKLVDDKLVPFPQRKVILRLLAKSRGDKYDE